MQYLHINHAFTLECGAILPELSIAYTTHGTLNEARNNVVWICHALTANADPLDWWEGLVGKGYLIDPERYFIVCANVLGSCYGTTGPTALAPGTQRAYGREWPLVTIRDMARAHDLLRHYLQIEHISLCIGGSLGGQQVLEWALLAPTRFEKLCVLATNARHSAWGIAFNETQRMALLADPTLYSASAEAGKKGLEAARAIAMLSYRHYDAYALTQSDPDESKLDNFRVSGYQRYQGFKLWRRFNPLAYLSLSRSMDSHNLGRNRGGVIAALSGITQPTLVIGIQSDVLFPVEEQAFLARYIPTAQLEVIHSGLGHDGFLVETPIISQKLETFLQVGIKPKLAPLNGLAGQRYALPGTEVF